MPLPTIHPGKALLDDMCELDLTVTTLAERVGLEPGFVRELLLEHEDVTPEVAEHLSRLGASAQYWLNLQANFDGVLRPGRNYVLSEQVKCVVVHGVGQPDANPYWDVYEWLVDGTLNPLPPDNIAGSGEFAEGNRIVEALRNRLKKS